MVKQKIKKWFDPEVTNTGWNKDLPADTRRALMLKHHGGNELAAGRALQALSNVTQDKETQALAAQDARELFKAHKRRRFQGKEIVPYRKKGIYLPRHRIGRISDDIPRISPATPRITPKTPRLR